VKLGLFGGSFDPIHFGHIRPVQEARNKLELDRVVFLPTAIPPHKPGRQFAPPHARYAMVELALLDERDFSVSPLELTPERPAYSVDSLHHFQRRYPDAELYLILGGDGFAELHTWRRWREIVRVAEIAVLTRPNWRWEEVREEVPAEIAQLAKSDRVHFVVNEPVAVSATELRERLAAGEEPPAAALPGLVLKYIRKYSLYQ